MHAILFGVDVNTSCYLTTINSHLFHRRLYSWNCGDLFQTARGYGMVIRYHNRYPSPTLMSHTRNDERHTATRGLSR